MRVPGDTKWPRLLLGLALVFALFHGVATATGSDRGQAGLLVGAIVVVATLTAERVFFGVPLAKATRDVGFGRPRSRGLVAAGLVCALLMLVFPAMSALEGSRPTVDPRWAALLPGLVSLQPADARLPLVWMAASAGFRSSCSWCLILVVSGLPREARTRS